VECIRRHKITKDELERLPEMNGQISLPTPFNTRCRDGGVCDNLSKDKNTKNTFSLKGPELVTYSFIFMMKC